MSDFTILSALQESVPNRSFGPGSDEYEAGRRVFYGVGAPDVVVRPQTAQEVAASVVAARKAGLPIAVRSGGHGSLPATEGVVVDLAAFDDVQVDDVRPGEGGLVRVGAGARWGAVAEALAPHGLAISSGDTQDVGVGGLALGGGVGWLVRRLGLTVDQLREVELVTADGDVLVANATTNPDLFWAVRGGGGNFGVVTHFTFHAAQVGPMASGTLLFDMSDVASVLRAWRDILAGAPETLNGTLLVMPALMPGMHSGPQLRVALEGTPEELRELLGPLLALPSHTEAAIEETRYPDLLEAAPPGAPPMTFVGGNGFLPVLTDEVIDAVSSAVVRDVPTMAMVRGLGGAFSRVDAAATAIPHRDAEAFLVVNAILPPEATASEVAAAREFVDAATSQVTGPYSGFTQEYGEQVLQRIYTPEALTRLRHIKAEVDPGNVFRPAHNITPEGGEVDGEYSQRT